jgi:hypothetical protein
MTKVQRNDIFRAVEAGGLDPSECEFGYQGNNAYLQHNISNSSLSIGGDGQDRYMCYVQVGDNKQTSFGAGDWGGVPPGIGQWASDVKRYVEIDAEIPYLWEELGRGKEFLADVQHNDTRNTPFTQAEQEQIVAQLQEIKKQVKEQFALSSEQMEQIEERLDEAAEAATHMGRKDWLIYVLGTITALIITATVEPGVGEHIFAMVIHALGHLFTGGSEPPQIPPRILA